MNKIQDCIKSFSRKEDSDVKDGKSDDEKTSMDNRAEVANYVCKYMYKY